MSTTSPAAVIAAASLKLAGGGGRGSPAQNMCSSTLAPALFKSGDRPKTAHVHVVPPSARFHGKTYAQWAAAFWKWALQLPLEGNPFTTCVRDFSIRQSGKVWFWSAPDSCPGPITATLPVGKALFLSIRDVETSSLEEPPFHGDTEAEQRANSKWWADHIVDLFCIIDGAPVKNIQAYRFSTPQIRLTATTPWIFGATGGPGTSVGDGYYLILDRLSKGKHIIHYGGTFHFDAGELGPDPVDFVKDITIDLRVRKTRAVDFHKLI